MIRIRTVCPSAHLSALCERLNELRGVALDCQSDDPGTMRRKVGWESVCKYPVNKVSAETTREAFSCELLVEMLREPWLIRERSKRSLRTVYICERWFKPLVIRSFRLPGILRLLLPSYFDMARQFVRLMDDPNVWFFPCGVHAVTDFVRLYRLLHGDMRCLFRAPHVRMAREIAGEVDGFPRMRLWGYFVDKSNSLPRGSHKAADGFLKVFWCGRMLDWKRVDILIKAFKKVIRYRPAGLLLVGEGPERARLERLAGKSHEQQLAWFPGRVSFFNYISSSKVRELMRECDVYVMPSNEEEGWGAAVSDAIMEGCRVISTWEAGSSATLLEDKQLYHCRNSAELAGLLIQFDNDEPETINVPWYGSVAAEKLLEVLG